MVFNFQLYCFHTILYKHGLTVGNMWKRNSFCLCCFAIIVDQTQGLNEGLGGGRAGGGGGGLLTFDNKRTILARTTCTNSSEGKPDLVVD